MWRSLSWDFFLVKKCEAACPDFMYNDSFVHIFIELPLQGRYGTGWLGELRGCGGRAARLPNVGQVQCRGEIRVIALLHLVVIHELVEEMFHSVIHGYHDIIMNWSSLGKFILRDICLLLVRYFVGDISCVDLYHGEMQFHLLYLCQDIKNPKYQSLCKFYGSNSAHLYNARGQTAPTLPDTTLVIGLLRGIGLINSLAPGRFQYNLRKIIFKLILVTDDCDISSEIGLRWTSVSFFMISQHWFR